MDKLSTMIVPVVAQLFYSRIRIVPNRSIQVYMFSE